MINPILFSVATSLAVLTSTVRAEVLVDGRKSLVLESEAARVVVDLAGGSIGDFRLRGNELNPLRWASPAPGDLAIRGFGHFLCLDRWGPASEAEAKAGMPYHGEAAHVDWRLSQDALVRDGCVEGQLSAALPMAGLAVRRTIRLATKAPVFAVREEVTNTGALGRIYNQVQHPTIGPPFLDETTVVDCNGRRGFAQGGSLPNPEEPSAFWPSALDAEGTVINLRRLTNNPSPNVVSYALDDAWGWVTAANPARGLLLGYAWPSNHYPWVSLWRDVHDGRPAARGLEFGTTGLHQPFPVLVQKGRIWERPLFVHLDAGETVARSYLAFLLAVPKDFGGVDSLTVENDHLLLRERSSLQPRTWRIPASGLIPTGR